MEKLNVSKMLKTAQKAVVKRSPEILTAMGVVGMCTTVVLAVKATPKAMDLIQKEKDRQNQELRDAAVAGEADFAQVSKLKTIEVLKVAWKPYVPAAITCVVSIGCIVGASSVSARRSAALYSAYKLSETALTEYKEKVVETIGEKKEKKVRDEIAKDKLEKSPVSKATVYMTGKGESLFYEPISDRYFMSDVETIRKAINDLNYSMGYGSEMYVSLSQLYDLIGLKHTSISDQLGWNIKHGQIEVDVTGAQISDDGRPCIVLDFLQIPQYGFESSY